MVPLNKIVFLVGLLLSACIKESYDSPVKYLKWVNNPSNGLIQVREANGLAIQVKYLPHEYLWLTSGEYPEELQDAKSTLSFILTINPLADQEKNIMLRDINTEVDFKQRVNQMNFGWENMVSMKFNDKNYPIVLANLENTYNLRPGKSLNLVFDLSLKELQQHPESIIDILLIDELFQTGLHHFYFKPTNLINVPNVP